MQASLIQEGKRGRRGSHYHGVNAIFHLPNQADVQPIAKFGVRPSLQVHTLSELWSSLLPDTLIQRTSCHPVITSFTSQGMYEVAAICKASAFEGLSIRRRPTRHASKRGRGQSCYQITERMGVTPYRHKWRIVISGFVIICPIFHCCRPNQQLLIQASPLIIDLLLLKVSILLCIIVLRSILRCLLNAPL